MTDSQPEVELLRRQCERERRARLEAEAIAERFARDALHDPLTGLPNRALFMDRLQHALNASDRERRPLLVLLLDLDGFKEINYSLGHGAGDQLLCAVASRLSAAVTSFDTVARLSGDEFAVLIENGRESRSDITERLARALATPLPLQGQSRTISASMGIAQSRSGQDTPSELLRKADMAMYVAKREGKSGYALFETGMHTAMVVRLEMKSDLQRALAQHEFIVHYQPIVRLPEGRLSGVEALVRWRRPGFGLVPPRKFVPLAEETGLIVPLGWWVLEESCRQFGQWRRKHRIAANLKLNVNVSAQQLHDPEASARVVHALRESSLPPASIVLELTEDEIMQDTESSLAGLRRLIALGVRLAIDDFGTGYSSLSQLQKLPAAVLKIDKSFIDRVSDGAEGGALVQAIVGLGSVLGLTVIAEGVEREEQAARLHALGCVYAQGHYFNSALDAISMEALLTATDHEMSISELTR